MTICERSDIVSTIVDKSKCNEENSTIISDYRKLSVDARQLRKELELTLERLPQILNKV